MLNFLLAMLFVCAPAMAEDEESATEALVLIETEKPGFTIVEILARGSAVSSSGGTATAVYTKDVCIAPCSFQTEPRMIELYGRGNGKLVRTQNFELRPGEMTLLAQPGSTALWTIGNYGVYLGLTALIGGVTVVAVDPDGEVFPTGAAIGAIAGGRWFGVEDQQSREVGHHGQPHRVFGPSQALDQIPHETSAFKAIATPRAGYSAPPTWWRSTATRSPVGQPSAS